MSLRMPFPIPNSGGKMENGPPGEIWGCSVQKAGSLTGGRCGVLQPRAEVFLFAVSWWKLEISCSGAAAFLPAQRETQTPARASQPETG